jgi:ribosome-associated protein
MKVKKSAALDTVKLCCRVLDDKKAEDVRVLDVAAQSSITDYLILATATSEPHLRALRVELEKTLDTAGSRIVGMEIAQASGWVVIDLFDVMVHLFLQETRSRYALERLWSDAVEVSASTLLKSPKSPQPKRPRAAAARPAKRRKQ